MKFEGLNPTGVLQGPRHDDGHLGGGQGTAPRPSSARRTGNTSASAAAYATKAGMTCAVLVPDGKIAMGKLSQAIAHGATLLQVDGNFDDCLTLARKLAEAYPVELVNSVNPARIEGQKTAAFEVVDALGDAPDIHCLPVGNAGNITAYWQGYREYHARGSAAAAAPAHAAPADVGLPGGRRRARSSSATPSTSPTPSRPRSGSATRPRGSRPKQARDESGGRIDVGHRRADPRRPPPPVGAREGIFVEPGSAASVAGLLQAAEAGQVPAGRHRRLHGHRARPQGPAVGPAQRRRLGRHPDPGPGRRVHRGARRWACED